MGKYYTIPRGSCPECGRELAITHIVRHIFKCHREVFSWHKRYCWLCGKYKPSSEMGEVACKECEGEEARD